MLIVIIIVILAILSLLYMIFSKSKDNFGNAMIKQFQQPDSNPPTHGAFTTNLQLGDPAKLGNMAQVYSDALILAGGLGNVPEFGNSVWAENGNVGYFSLANKPQKVYPFIYM